MQSSIGVWRVLVALLIVAAVALAACAPQRAEQGAPQAQKSAPPVEKAGGSPSTQSAGAPAAQPAKPSGAATYPTMTLKFNHVVAINTPKHKAAQKFADLVKERSGGAINVQIFPNSELYKDGEELEALQSGAIHFVAPGTDKFGVLVPKWEALVLPYVFDSADAARKLYDPNSPVAKEFYEALRPKGMLGLAIWENGWKHFTDSKRPLIKPEDFKGLKFRTSGKPDEAFVKALGGSAVVMAFSEVFSALQQGAIDGQFNTWSNTYTQKFHEVQKYATIADGAVFLLYGVATNAKWWDGLDANTRKLLSDAMAEATVYGNKLAADENDQALEAIKKSGRLQFHQQTKEEAAAWAKAGEEVQKQWESRVGADTIAKLKAIK